MADRKRPVKKKATKKIKKTSKPEEKIKERLKEKAKERKSTCLISQHSLPRTRSGQQMKELSEELIRKRSSKRSVGSVDVSVKPKESLHKSTDEYKLGKKKSKDISHHRANDSSSSSDDDTINIKISKQLSQRHRDESNLLNKKKSKELSHIAKDEYSGDDLLGIKRSKGLSYRQVEELNDLKSYKDELKIKKSIELSRLKQSSLDQRSKKKLRDLDEKSEHKSTKDMYKNIRYKRSSRIGLSSMYASSVRASAGASKGSKEKYRGPNKYDYIAQPDHARTNLKIGITLMEICGAAFITLMFAYGFSDDVAATLYFQDSGERNGKLYHIALASIWIFLAGNAMILYRLFNQSKVRSIKYFHLTVHAIGFLCVCLSLHAYKVFWEWKGVKSNDGKVEHNYSIHSKLGIAAMWVYLFQFTVSLCIYSLKFFNQACRAKFYHYHSFFGFVVFFAAIAAMCTGLIMEEKFKRLGYSNNQYAEKWLPKIGGIAGILFSGGVLFIVIYPYFDFSKEFEEL